MGKAHVLDAGVDGVVRIVFHITTPAGNNDAGVSWATALKNSGVGGSTTLPDGTGSGGTISTTEKTDVLNGAVYEVEDRVFAPAGMNAAQANAFLDALHTAKQTEVQTQLQARLRYFGYTRS